MFQSSFELTGYITATISVIGTIGISFQSSFELTGYITNKAKQNNVRSLISFQSSFELTGYITKQMILIQIHPCRFKALSSLRVI